MRVSSIHSIAFLGMDSFDVEVETDISIQGECPTVHIVGLPDTSVRESKDRVLTAIRNSGYTIPTAHIMINLAPGGMKKEGSMYDLPIAIGILSALGIIKTTEYKKLLIVGELSLVGEVRPIRGALPMAMHAQTRKKKGVMLSHENGREAATVSDLDVIAVKNIREAVEFLNGSHTLQRPISQWEEKSFPASHHAFIDFSDVRGQEEAKRGVEIAAAGYHNILLSGPPGSGKSMLAKALPSILPPLSFQEALEVTKIHSLAGTIPKGKNCIMHRPFRAPHHTVSHAGLVGGGGMPRPGEISLAHHGILFLDELPEFSRSTLEALRQPLEDQSITISRAQAHFTFPTSILFIAAMNPCPCGNFGHPKKICSDTPVQIHRYRNKISGPLLDRIDIHIDVPALRYEEFMGKERTSHESSEQIAKRVKRALQYQSKRLGGNKKNAQMQKKEIAAYCSLQPSSEKLMQQAIDYMGFSIRACDRILRVARTIADLEEKESIQDHHLSEAIHFRSRTEESSPMMATV